MTNRRRIELQPPRHGSEAKESPGIVEAQRALKKRRGAPSEADAPALRTFAGSQPPEIPGQLRIDEC